MKHNEIFETLELAPSWYEVLKEEFQKPYFAQLTDFLIKERQGPIAIYPPQDLIFNALLKTPFKNVKVVILGQDPYHGKGEAHGLCFSVPEGVPLPPSLKNIFKELHADIGLAPPRNGCLLKWAEQGVLLLNTILTVREKEPLSHSKQGWENFTNAILNALLNRSEPVIFVLWGKTAQKKWKDKSLDIHSRHSVLESSHPSPLGAHQGFLGCRHFSRVNQLLIDQGRSPINWDNSSC